MFVLWDDEALRSWLAKEPTIPLRTDTERLHRVIAECRTRGYLVERLTPRRAAALRADGGRCRTTCPTNCARCSAKSSPTSASGSICAANLRSRKQRHDISVISAPVFDHHGRQAMVASLQIGRALTDAEITEQPAAWSRRQIR